MSSTSRIMAVSALLLALAGSPLFAGVVFEVETTYPTGSDRGPEKSQVSVEGSNLKMEILPGAHASGGQSRDEAVFRGDRREVVIVDHDTKTYMVMDKENLGRIGGEVKSQMQEAMKEVEKHLAQLDPEQRAMAEKVLKGRLGAALGKTAATRPQSEYERTSERAERQGYPCVKYDVTRDGEKIRELWVTDWANVPGGKDVADAFRDMASFYSEILDSFSETAGLGGLFDVGNPIESLTEVDGFPVVTRTFEDGELESETVLGSVTERDLDPDAFEPPKGYKLRTMGPP